MQHRGSNQPAVALTIAGFDPSSGAGVTADLKTFAAHGIFGLSAVTALTVQSTRGVRGVEPVRPELLVATLDELEADLPAAGIKVGMLGRGPLVEATGDYLRQVRRVRPLTPIVLDPVIRSSSGRSLLSEGGVAALRDRLLPCVTAVTPNWAELAILSERAVDDPASARLAAEALARRFPDLAVIATGGDAPKPVDGLLLPGGRWVEFAAERVETSSTHGTGCAFSSALLCGLMGGQAMEDAVASAKAFVTEALRRAPGLGSGKGPLALLWPLQSPAADTVGW